MAAGLAVLMRVYGTVVLLYPWNPYMPVLFWMLFLVCVWGVLCGDLLLLPVAVAAGCLCAQTHVPYLGLVGGMGGLVVVALAWQHRQARGDAAARRRVVRWGLGQPGARRAVVGARVPRAGRRRPRQHLDPHRQLLEPDRRAGGRVRGLAVADRAPRRPAPVRGEPRRPAASQIPGIALLAVWAASAAVAARLRDRTLVMLHVVVAAALLLGLVTISRIFGATWFYLTLWAFGTAALTLVAVVATAAARGARRARPPGRPVTASSASSGRRSPCSVWRSSCRRRCCTRAAPDTADVDVDESDQLGAVIDPTVDAIESGVIPGGHDGTFFMSWADPVNLGGQGLGLMLELERRGYDARSSVHRQLSVRAHRVVDPGEADAEIHLAVGVPAIERARDHPGGAGDRLSRTPAAPMPRSSGTPDRGPASSTD